MKRFTSVMVGVPLVLVGYTAHSTLARPEALRPASAAVIGVSPADFSMALPATGDGSTKAVTPVPETAAPDYNLLILQYCVVCHNDVALTGNLTLQTFKVDEAEQHGETAEKAVISF